MNVFSVSGNLGKDGELREAGGTQVLNFSIADTIGFGDKKRTQWVNCAIWGKRAQALAPHLKKGMKVTAWGELEMREYEKRDGGKDKNLNMNVSQIAMHGAPEAKQQQQEAGGGFGSEADIPSDEIPF